MLMVNFFQRAIYLASAWIRRSWPSHWIKVVPMTVGLVCPLEQLARRSDVQYSPDARKLLRAAQDSPRPTSLGQRHPFSQESAFEQIRGNPFVEIFIHVQISLQRRGAACF